VIKSFGSSLSQAAKRANLKLGDPIRSVTFTLQDGKMEISTGTATICIFDKACLAHRKDDIGDWWSLPQNELQEAIEGNALFLNVGEDGTYRVNISSHDFDAEFEYGIVVKSGEIFVGPGEEASGGGFEPDGSWGGGFISLKPGNYTCKIKRKDKSIELYLSHGGDGRNSINDLIRI
jgi:Family of unknown function (DUF6386)